VAHPAARRRLLLAASRSISWRSLVESWPDELPLEGLHKKRVAPKLIERGHHQATVTTQQAGRLFARQTQARHLAMISADAVGDDPRTPSILVTYQQTDLPMRAGPR